MTHDGDGSFGLPKLATEIQENTSRPRIGRDRAKSGGSLPVPRMISTIKDDDEADVSANGEVNGGVDTEQVRERDSDGHHRVITDPEDGDRKWSL